MSDIRTDPVVLAQELVQQVLSLGNARIDRSADEPNDHAVRNRIQNICDDLLRNVLGPMEYTALLATSCHESQALYFVTVIGIPDFIGDETATLDELGRKAGVSTRSLGVAMSCLLGHGYFEEIGEFGSRMYRNNSFSNILRESHQTTMKDAVGFIGDEAYKASSRLLDAAKETPGEEKKLPGVNLAFGFDMSIFEWMSKPEEAWRGQRLGKAMQQLHRMANGNVPLDYNWGALQSPIVDIGGGIGSLEMALLKHEANSSLDFILFDIPRTIEDAKKVWSAQAPSESSRVSFVSGSFMVADDLPKGHPTYVVRHVLHDWTDDEAVAILSNVRAVMEPASRLVVCEMLLHPDASRFVRTISMQLLALNNGITRTQGEMMQLVEKAGFKITKVNYMRAADSIIEAVIS
ncbi:S-adenosyl-L-methionine-dependent methyltransferase [Neolentinus lepideus HHB14362 ss-1]|uniref:S-adenosyl-L-methionine-dependent methyltransferase n=1 Tax=Neolentinus lepideus HHB14362 ss-1 TaxID=1314782 RepID=A0A165P6U3_9AGAM|nr:S-adenosyl-L-methionine-dependent methyltransferase [Neolentinus lepideus HHB14362 ss-1]